MDSPQSERRAIAIASTWRVIEIIASEGITFGVFLLLARLVAPADFGAIAVSTAILSFGVSFLSPGFTEYLVQCPTITPSLRDSALCLNGLLGVLLSIVLYLCAPLAGRIMGDAQVARALYLMAPILVMTAVSAVFQAVLRRELRFKAFTLRTILAVLLGGGTGITMALRGWGLWSLVCQQLVYNATALVVLAFCSDWRPRWRISALDIRQLVAFGRPMVLSSLTDFLWNRADIIIIGLFQTPATVAYFFFAKRLVFSLGMLTTNTIQQVGMPAVARSLREAASSLQRERIVTNLLVISVIVCGAAFGGLSLIGQPLIPILSGPAWNGSLLPLEILAAAAFFNGVRLTSGQALIAAGRPGANLLIAITTGLSCCGFLALGAPHGLPSAALSLVAAHIVSLTVAFWVLHRALNLSIKRTAFALSQASVPTVVMVGSLLLLRSRLLSLPPLLNLLISCTGGAVIYGAIGMLIPEFRAFAGSCLGKVRRNLEPTEDSPSKTPLIVL